MASVARVMGRREHREVLVRASGSALRARLLANPTADLLWAMLPIYSLAETGAGLIHFAIVEEAPAAVLPAKLAGGSLAYSPSQQRIAIGVVPQSRVQSRLTDDWQVWATTRDDPADLAHLDAGERIAILVAES